MSDIDQGDLKLFMLLQERYSLSSIRLAELASTMPRSSLFLLLMRPPTFPYASLSMSAHHYHLGVSGDTKVRSSTF